MKIIILAFTLIIFSGPAFTQSTKSKTSGSQGTINIDVPDFTNPAIKQFYEAYTAYLKKGVTAVRNKDEAACRKLYKEPKELDEYRKQMSKSKPSPEDVKKKQAWNKQAMPYIMEMQQSEIVKKLEQEDLKNK